MHFFRIPPHDKERPYRAREDGSREYDLFSSFLFFFRSKKGSLWGARERREVCDWEICEIILGSSLAHSKKKPFFRSLLEAKRRSAFFSTLLSRHKEPFFWRRGKKKIVFSLFCAFLAPIRIGLTRNATKTRQNCPFFSSDFFLVFCRFCHLIRNDTFARNIEVVCVTSFEF